MSEVKKKNEKLTILLIKEWKVVDDETLKKFECPICLDFLTDPMVHSLCGNVFCSHCIKKVSNCPKCGKQVLPSNIIPEPNLIKEVLELIELIIKKQNELIIEIISKRWLYEFHEDKEKLEKYECPVCCDILTKPISHSIDENLFCIDFDNHPIVHSLCGNMFCKKCISKVDKFCFFWESLLISSS